MEEANKLFVGRFRSTELARRARAVRWRIDMDNGVRAGLISFLAKRKSSKRKAPDVPPDREGGEEEDPPRQPLVNIQPRDCVPAATNALHYTLGGRAGRVDLLPKTQFVTIKKLKDNLLPPSSSCNDENSCRPLVLQSYGSDQFWVCTGVTSVATHHLSTLRKQVQVAIN